MNTFNLIIRLIAFGITTYILLEFSVACHVSTWIALLGAFLTVVFVITFFILFKRYDMTQCSQCKEYTPRSFFGGNKGKNVSNAIREIPGFIA